jgi:hypothetical protein
MRKKLNSDPVIGADGIKRWYDDSGSLYCIEYPTGGKYWLSDNGRCYHRLDGPAIEYINGNKYWYVNDKRINCSSQEEFERLMKLKAFW